MTPTAQDSSSRRATYAPADQPPAEGARPDAEPSGQRGAEPRDVPSWDPDDGDYS